MKYLSLCLLIILSLSFISCFEDSDEKVCCKTNSICPPESCSVSYTIKDKNDCKTPEGLMDVTYTIVDDSFCE